MAIYDVSGDSLQVAYDVSGDSLQVAYDVSGDELYGSERVPHDTSGDVYPLNNVVQYYRDSTLDAATEIDNLSDSWETFVFVTDPHGSANKQHSQAIALYLLANTDVKMIVLGGDYSASNWSKTEYDNWVAPFVESDYIDSIYAVIGNHETYGTGATEESKASVYNDFIKDKSVTGNQTECYYYFDDAVKRTRYMFLNTSDSGATTMSAEQIQWITQNVQLPNTSWSLVVFGHVNLDSLDGLTTMNESNATAIINAIKTCNGKIVGYICGHQHIDAISTTSGAFKQATLLNDRFENQNYYDGYSVTNRVANTVTEQSISVVSFNKITKHVIIRKIGACKATPIGYYY